MADNVTDIGLGETSFAKDMVRCYQDAKSIRMPFESEWRQVAEWGLPTQYGGWAVNNAPQSYAGSGATRNARIRTYDSTLKKAIPIFAAVLARLQTPASQIYHALQAEDERLRLNPTIMRGLAKLNSYIFRKRYEPLARFEAAQGAVYKSIGAYGNAGKLVTWREPNRQLRRRGGFLYQNIQFRNLFWNVDDQDQIFQKFRRIDWNKRQAMIALGDNCPAIIKRQADDSTQTFEFVHVVTPSKVYDEHALDYRRHPIGSYYFFVEKPTLVKEASGYSSDPLIISRTDADAGQPYGYGAAQLVLSSGGLLNAMKKTWIRHGQLSAQPALLTRDDGVMSINQTPGAQNPGGVNAAGQKLVHQIEPGNFQPAEKLMLAEQQDIKDALFGRIFEIVRDQPQKTATEIIDIAAREAAQLAPTMGLMQAEDLGPQIEREINLLGENGELAALELPSELQNTEYMPVYTSPLAKSQKSEGTAGFMRLSTMAIEIATATGDNRPVRRLNFDVALPEIADQQGVDPRWIKTNDEMAASDAEVAKQEQAKMLTDVAAPAASVFKTLNDNQMKAAPQ